MSTIRPVGSVLRAASGESADVVDSLRLSLLIAYLQSELYSRASSAVGFVPTADATVEQTIMVEPGTIPLAGGVGGREQNKSGTGTPAINGCGDCGDAVSATLEVHFAIDGNNAVGTATVPFTCAV